MALRPKSVYTQPRGHVRTAAPAVEPVFAEELRNFVRADIDTLTDDDAAFFIQTAREFLEELTGIAFITQTWSLALDHWPGYEEPWWDGVRELPISELRGGRGISIELPRYPLISVGSVKTYDEASTETTNTLSTYFDIDAVRKPGRLSLKSGQLWPSASRPTNAILITYTAGYGADSSYVPAGLRGAVLNLAGYYYLHRGECDLGEAAKKSGALTSVGMYAGGRA